MVLKIFYHKISLLNFFVMKIFFNFFCATWKKKIRMPY